MTNPNRVMNQVLQFFAVISWLASALERNAEEIKAVSKHYLMPTAKNQSPQSCR